MSCFALWVVIPRTGAIAGSRSPSTPWAPRRQRSAPMGGAGDGVARDMGQPAHECGRPRDGSGQAGRRLGGGGDGQAIPENCCADYQEFRRVCHAACLHWLATEVKSADGGKRCAARREAPRGAV